MWLDRFLEAMAPAGLIYLPPLAVALALMTGSDADAGPRAANENKRPTKSRRAVQSACDLSDAAA